MGNVIKICHLEAWSIVVNHGSLLDVNESDLRKLCTFEYGIDVTPEVYRCIRDDILRLMPLDNARTKFFYFKKSIREVPENEY